MKTPQTRTSYGFGTRLSLPYSEAVERVKAALKEEGFGVLTEIDVTETLKQKLGKDFRKYVILGACNPPIAYQALQAELEIGLMMPCNVIVYEEVGGSKVMVVDPKATLGRVNNEALRPLAEQIVAKLERVVQSLEQS
jgi:uncharacterized protein (DUF302 family)